MTMIKIKKYTDDDLNWLVKLNNDCVPAVNFQSADEFSKDQSFWDSALVATKDGKPLGIVILIREGTGYASNNYAWHNRQNDQHLYVDRIIIGNSARGLGIGRKLYDVAMRLSADYKIPLTAEVNTVPDNPQSHAFHIALGFDVVGEIEHKPGYSVRFYSYKAKI